MEIFLGSLISVIVQYAKRKWNIEGTGVIVLVLILAMVSAIVYQIFVYTNVWKDILEIMIVAAAFHNFILRNIGNSIQSQ